MKKEQEKIKTIARDKVENPPAVKGIKPAAKNSIPFQSYIQLDKDIVLPCGKILHKSGTKVSPLQHTDLNRKMFLIDSRELAQIKCTSK